MQQSIIVAGRGGRMSGTGSGFQVVLDELVSFSSKIATLIGELDDTGRASAQTALGGNAFGDFAEAHELQQRHEKARQELGTLLHDVQQAHQLLTAASKAVGANYQDNEFGSAGTITDAGRQGALT
jgi:hypothetical protein